MATNTKKVKGLQIPFKEFMPGQLIISSQFNDDMKDIEDKVNEIIDEHNVMSEEIDAHTDNTENPHQVNAHQVGTYDSGEIDEFVNDLRNGEFNDNVIENNVLADDCIDTRNYRDASITSSKVEPSFGSQLDISENIEIKTRYTKQETDELIKTKVGDGTYSKEELDTKFEEVQAGVIIDSTIGIEKLKPNIGNEIDISQNVNIVNRYTKDEVDYLIRTNALPRDWGSILEADENESFQSNDTGIFPVADYMVSDMFISPASNVLDFDIKEVVDSRNGHNSLNERLTEDNKKHNFYINALLDENTGNRLSVESDKNTITLKDCKEGFVEIKKIVGNTLSTSENVQSTFEDKLVTQEMIDSGIEKKENLGKYKVGAKVVGKNKIDFKNIKVLNTNSSTHEVINGGLRIKYSGVNTSTSKSYTYIRSELYEINPDVKRLILSYKHNSNKNQKPRILVKLFDSKTSSTSIKDYSVTGFTNMEIPQNAKYYQLVIYSCNGEAGIVKGDYVDYIDVQLEEVLDSSINTTQYEPYKECITNVYLNSPLAKGDEIVAKEDGLYHYHKMKKVVLDNTSKLSMPNSVYQPTNTNYIIFGYEDNTIKTNVTCHCDRFNVLPSSTVSKNLASEGVWVHSTTNSIRICVLKSKLTPVDISGFNKWLQDNPITIIYELTKPYYEKISDDKFISRISSGATLHIENKIPHQSVTVNYTGNISLPSELYPVLSNEIGVVKRIYPYGDVRRYGAVGNGEYDNTIAFKNCLKSLGSVWSNIPNTMYIPSGTWKYRESISIDRNNLTIKGDGIEQTILLPVDCDGIKCTGTIKDTRYGVVIKDLAISGGRIGMDTSFLGLNCRISNISIHSCSSYGYYCNSGFDHIVDNVVVRQSRDLGFYINQSETIGNSTFAEMSYITFNNCVAVNCNNQGTQWKISGNNMYLNNCKANEGVLGIEFVGTTWACRIINFYMDGTGKEAVMFKVNSGSARNITFENTYGWNIGYVIQATEGKSIIGRNLDVNPGTWEYKALKLDASYEGVVDLDNKNYIIEDNRLNKQPYVFFGNFAEMSGNKFWVKEIEIDMYQGGGEFEYAFSGVPELRPQNIFVTPLNDISYKARDGAVAGSYLTPAIYTNTNKEGWFNVVIKAPNVVAQKVVARLQILIILKPNKPYQ